MIAKWQLTSPIFNTQANPTRIATGLSTSAAELERDVKENIQRSKPAGKTYRTNAITARPSRNRAGVNLRKRGGNLIVGFRFHRASAPGQPPAIRTGRLINSIGARRVGPMRYRVGTSVNYALPLDARTGLNRPFFRSRVYLYRPRFIENMRIAYLGK